MGVRARMASAFLLFTFTFASSNSANVDASVAVEGVREAAGARRDDTPQISPSEHCAEEPLQYVLDKYVCE